MAPGTRYIVSLGDDEQAQLAVSGSLTLAAARFLPVEPDLAGLPSSADAYAALGWDASLRTPMPDGTTVIDSTDRRSLLEDE